MTEFSILVLSDLHMHGGKPTDTNAPSYLSSQPLFTKPLQNPITDAALYLKSLDLKPNWIVCPGDLIDKNDVAHLGNAWQQIIELKSKLGAKAIFGSVGNHDLDSRRKTSDDLPADQLKALTPSFPIHIKTKFDKFWADGYCFYTDKKTDSTIAILNSCMFHGVEKGSEIDVKELNRGKISKASIQSMRSEINKIKTSRNIVLLHHHIRQHPKLVEDSSQVENGIELLKAFAKSNQSWMFIHGHQHYPYLNYESVEDSHFPILSAASVAAVPYMVEHTVARNQMHLIKFPSNEHKKEASRSSNTRLQGVIHSWDWAKDVGWTNAVAHSGLPAVTGFGASLSADQLAERAIETVKAQDLNRISWKELVSRNPEYQYLPPNEATRFNKIYAKLGGIVAYDEYGSPFSLELQRDE